MCSTQEWLARYDRQRLARDIYTLLYLTGGGYDNQNYATAVEPANRRRHPSALHRRPVAGNGSVCR